MGRKADASLIVPLCAACHRLLHRIGRRNLEARFGVDLSLLAARIAARWDALSSPS